MMGTLRLAYFTLGLAIFTVVLMLGLLIWVIAGHPKAPAYVAPCSADAMPCIKITEADGTIYKFNDFRFEPDHCIVFMALPDKSARNYCGNYKLDWIGPSGSTSTL